MLVPILILLGGLVLILLGANYLVDGASSIAKKFGITRGSLHNYMYRKELKINLRTNRRAKLKEQEWEAFWAGETVENIQNAPESLENDRSETNVSSEGESAVSENASESRENDRSEEHFAEATKNLWNDMAEEAKWKLVEQTRETIADLEKQVVANSPKLKTCGRYGEAPSMTLDEVVTEQPFSMGSMNVCLKDIRDWGSVVKALSSFPLPLHNSVTIMIREVKEE